MSKLVSRALGRKAAKHAHRRGWLDVRLGIRLLRDNRIGAGTKLLALALGVGATLVLLALEVPLEAIVTAIMPLLIGFDIAIDGIEMVALPLIFGAILLTHLAPKPIVEAARLGA
ncbi:hypothetical protein [Fimbriimonas ginsengisoli]|uniref:Uncharacterized protein n=1 Tax=Fimbriimonas ginsengisoli Gsoil 348 TaxID=661478 RepID=A0A068NQN1_FIMGI|nr:hypothetical protein [Fimbriimonas ginsengisoli]AIE83909.1 hypothetical protein OP10G_0541 [Fimbriimonas ginsengisoli Gsoil 348]